MATWESLAWGAVLRTVQCLFQAAPFIVTGLFITGVLHRLLGHSGTRQLFGSNSLRSQIQSWLIGMVLPGCSLGAIPIVRQMRRSGISVGTIFAFALASPLFDPLSLLYGLTLSKPLTILAFAACSLVVLTVCGSLFDHWFPQTEQPQPEPVATPAGWKRLLAILVVMSRESVGRSAAFIAIGLLGAGVLSLLLPAGSLQRSVDHADPRAPIVMMLVAIPAYATPMVAMSQLGSMFQHGNSIGAAFILLAFGAGMNLGLLAWMFSSYGWRKAVAWLTLIVVVVLGLSYGIERPLYPRDIEPADHTHAFDAYCAPFPSEFSPVAGYPAEVLSRLRQGVQLHEVAGLLVLAGLMVTGIALRQLDRVWSIEAWLNRSGLPDGPPSSGKSWDFNVPGPVLAVCCLVMVFALSIVGAFAYYPSPDETIEELKIANTEALSGALSRRLEESLAWIPTCEAWNRRLQVGVYLRRGSLSDYHRAKARAYQDQLEVLEHLLEADPSPDALARQIAATSKAFQRLAFAYTEEL